VLIHHEAHKALGSEMDCSTTRVSANYEFIVDYPMKSRWKFCAITPSVILLANKELPGTQNITSIFLEGD
jgi:hypothetical protein